MQTLPYRAIKFVLLLWADRSTVTVYNSRVSRVPTTVRTHRSMHTGRPLKVPLTQPAILTRLPRPPNHITIGFMGHSILQTLSIHRAPLYATIIQPESVHQLADEPLASFATSTTYCVCVRTRTANSSTWTCLRSTATIKTFEPFFQTLSPPGSSAGPYLSRQPSRVGWPHNTVHASPYTSVLQ